MAKIDRMTSFIPGKRKKPSTKTDNQPEAKKPKEDKPQGGNGSGTNGTTILGAGGPCIVGPYSKIKNKCGEGQQAHHIIPDTLNRTSNRSQGAKGIGRIPGMPHLPDGPSICFSGQAKVDGTEHNEAHKGDVEIRTAALRTDNGPVGTIPVNEAVPIAMQSAINARPECKMQIEEVVRKAYPNYEKDNRSMNGAGKPATGETKLHLDDGKTSRDGNIMNTTKKRGRGG